jgi:hypothetical protein
MRGERRARACIGGLGALPPVGPSDKAPGRGSGGSAPEGDEISAIRAPILP